MLKEKELSNNIIDNIDELMEMYPVECLFLENKVEGNLKDFLKALSSEQLYIVAKAYYERDELNNKHDNELIKLLDRKIKENFLDILSGMPYKQYVNIENLANNKEIDAIAQVFVYAGIVYGYLNKKEEVIYVLPNDIKKIYLEKVTKEDKATALKSEVVTKLFSMFFSMGLVDEDFIFDYYGNFDNLFTKEELLKEIKDAILIKDINNKKYLWLKDIPYKDEYAINLENRRYIKRKIQDYVSYMMRIMLLVETIVNIIDIPRKEAMNVIISKLLLKERDSLEILKDFSDEFNLSKKDKKKLEEIIDEEYDNIRFWENGGNTIDEGKIENLMLQEKPKKTTLKECLNKLSNEGLAQLLDSYYLDDTYEIEDAIIDDFKEEGINYFDEYEEIQDILSLDNEPYNGNDTITSFIINGYAYIYKDKEEVRVIIPDEIKEIINNFDLSDDYGFNGLDDREILNLYMLYNGIIEKKILQRLLQENHDLEYTIDELDTVIKTLDMYSIDNYYCVLDETDEVIDKFLLPSKKNFKKYKEVDFDSYYELDFLNTLESELRSYINKLCKNEDDAREIGMYIITLINMNCYVPDILIPIFEDYKIKASNTDYKNINNIINKYKNDIPIWAFNGYTKKEVNSMPKEKKVGRNDPCPCGSGKKYKKCCGK